MRLSSSQGHRGRSAASCTQGAGCGRRAGSRCCRETGYEVSGILSRRPCRSSGTRPQGVQTAHAQQTQTGRFQGTLDRRWVRSSTAGNTEREVAARAASSRGTLYTFGVLMPPGGMLLSDSGGLPGRLGGGAQAARADEEVRVAPELGGSAGPSADQAQPLAEVRTSQTNRLGLWQAQPCARRTPAEAEPGDPAAARAKSEAPEGYRAAARANPGEPAEKGAAEPRRPAS